MKSASMLACIAAGLAALAAPAARAQAVSLSAAPGQAPAPFSDAELLTARSPMPLARFLPASALDHNAAAAEARSAAVVVDSPGRRPVADARALAQTRRLGAAALALLPPPEVVPEAVGTGGIHFTSSRTYPRQQDRVYPSSAVGKLFFRDRVGNAYLCSGSVLRPGVVLTAGHCVHEGRGGNAGFYTDFVFIPGYSRVGATEVRPFGTWSDWAYAATTTAWINGGRVVPNVGDWGLLVFRPDAKGRHVGSYTGTLGYQYPAMIGRHVTVLGYPVNLDGGTQMHRVDSMVTNYGTNNGSYGSDMGGGSSGGPVVLNFRQDYAGLSSLTRDNNANRATSVVSFGFTVPTPQIQGGAQFDANFEKLLTDVCNRFKTAC